MVAKGPAGELGKNNGCASKSRAMMSDVSLELSVLSKMLKSKPPPLTLCRLRRFAEGLSKPVWSSCIAPSLLLSGLIVVASEPKLPLRRFSMRPRLGFKAILLFSTNGTVGPGIESGGVVLSLSKPFSSPVTPGVDCAVVAFP